MYYRFILSCGIFLSEYHRLPNIERINPSVATLGILNPPSIIQVMMADQSWVSVGKLFAAGVPLIRQTGE